MSNIYIIAFILINVINSAQVTGGNYLCLHRENMSPLDSRVTSNYRTCSVRGLSALLDAHEETSETVCGT